MNDTRKARDRLVEDFVKVIDDSEVLLKAIAAASGEKAQTLRADLEGKLQAARARLDEFEKEALQRTHAAAEQADEYVHANPWQSIAIAAGVAAIAGIVVGLLLNRR